ncbi:hypothetical protein B484DRAFT_472994, partial [Ochromonadaceae sp. CCMP2298]
SESARVLEGYAARVSSRGERGARDRTEEVVPATSASGGSRNSRIRAVDEDDPIEQVLDQVVRGSVMQGSRRVSSRESIPTDALGVFFGKAPAGRASGGKPLTQSTLQFSSSPGGSRKEELVVVEKIQASKSKVGSKERAPKAKGIYSGIDAPPIPKVAGQDSALCSAQALIFLPNIWDPWTDGDVTMICSMDDRISDANGGEKQSRWALVNVARAFCNDLFDRKTSTEELGILIHSRLQWAIQQRDLPGTHRVRYKQAGEGSPVPFNNIAFTEMSLMTLASLSPVQLVYYLHEQNIPSDWVPWESVELADFAESRGKQYSTNPETERNNN